VGRKIKSVQTSFTSGELDPKLRARMDIKHYYSGAERLRNARVVPQGGAGRRPGLAYKDAIAFQVSRITAAVTITLPSGGATGSEPNANDGDESTTITTTDNISTTDPYVIVHYDLASAKTVLFADVRGILITAGTTDEVVIQYSTDDAAWVTVGTAFDEVAVEGINRRRRADVTARYWRVAKVGGTDETTAKFTLAEFNLMEKSSTLSAVREISFQFSTTQRYTLVATDLNLAVYRSGALEADISIPHTTAQLGEMSWTQSLDTLLLFHEDVQTHQVQRKGAHDEWGDEAVTFSTFPTSLFSDTATAPAITPANDGEGDTGSFTAASAYFTADMVGWRIIGLNSPGENTGIGLITAYNNATDVTVYNVTAWSEGLSAIQNPVIQEVSWSTTRGWPRCGTFHEGGLWLAGSSSGPQTLWRSVIGEFFNFNAGTALADEGINVTLDTDSVAAIYNLRSGRHLQIFTESAEFYVLPNSEPITPANIVPKRTSDIGSDGPGRRVVGLDGSTLFLQKGGRALREFLFTDQEQAYSSENIALLSSHLLVTPVDIAARRATSTDEQDLVYVVNSDGTMAVLQTLRSQGITAWTLLETDGSFLAVVADGDDVYVIVERLINSVTVRFLELLSDVYFLDSSVRYTAGLPTATFTGLDHLEGETLQVRCDDLVLADVTVSSGSVTISQAATSYCEIGLAFPDVKEGEVTRLQAEGQTEAEARMEVFGTSDGTGSGDGVWIKDMPVEGQLEDGTIIGSMKRIHEAWINIYRTQGFWMGVNNKALREMVFRVFGPDTLDEAPPEISGDQKFAGLKGWSRLGQVEITQRDPVPMTIRRILKKVSI
jgi:hypothetical protein